MWPETIWKWHIHAEEGEKDGRKICCSLTNFNSLAFVAFCNVSCTQTRYGQFFHRCIISIVSARALFWDKPKYIANKLFILLSLFFYFPGWQLAWLLPSNNDWLRASAVPALCVLPGREWSAKILIMWRPPSFCPSVKKCIFLRWTLGALCVYLWIYGHKSHKWKLGVSVHWDDSLAR